MTRQKLSQRPRQVSPTRPRSRTMCSTPAATSSWLSERPACPAPTMTTSTFEFIDPDCRRHEFAHGTVWADSLPENLSKVLNGMLAVLDEVMEKGPSEDELHDDVEALRKSVDNPGWPMALLDSQLTHELFGTTMRTMDEAIAELEKMTPADYAALLREIFPSLLTIVPPGVAVLDPRLTAVPAWSTEEARGTVYRLRAATSVVAQQTTSLTLGDTAITLRQGPESWSPSPRRVRRRPGLGRRQPNVAVAR